MSNDEEEYFANYSCTNNKSITDLMSVSTIEIQKNKMKTKHTTTMEKNNMQTMVSVLDSLTTLGFTTQFKATEKGIISLKTQKTFSSGKVKVVHFYRFEGESDPSDSSIVFAIETDDGEKGTLVDGYGTSGDSQVTDFMRQVENINR